MNKTAYQRAHRRAVKQSFSPGFTAHHRMNRGYLPQSKETPDEEGRKFNDSHGWRGRKPRKPRQRR